MKSVLFAALCFVGSALLAAEPAHPVINLWPGTPPGDKGQLGEEHDSSKPNEGLVAGKPVIRWTDVSKPTITIYPATSSKKSGAAVLVCPGGGYRILALDLEGTEVCEWLNSIGVTAALLKYRVPAREGDDKHQLPLEDAQRALSVLRHRAAEWEIDRKKIGVLGFSAGGHLAANLSINYANRDYEKIDEADDESCRPDFSVLIYPAYLVTKGTEQISPDLNVTEKTPPTFMVMAADDPVHVENVLAYGFALKKVKVPFEVHVYPSGGHGYGMRPRKEASVTTWPERATEWMRGRGLLKVE
ncbi:MAG TPA: alpha/beta hydrolase [Candidatus Dormibacteraeota bacterium]|nr:alpha/beta hydrolase [Candidatus Dormibacteraeota bacterium]